MKRLALIAALCGGCQFGMGSAYVGQWRPRTQPKFDACLEDESGACTETKQVVEQVPQRKFWGYTIVFPSIGAAITTRNGETDVHARFELATEYLRGRGKFAWGVRASTVLDTNSMISINGMGTVYYSLSDRLAVRAGLGVSPYTTDEGSNLDERAVGGRALAGIQLAFLKTRNEGFLVLSIDVDRMYVAFEDPLPVTRIVGNIGIFF